MSINKILQTVAHEMSAHAGVQQGAKSSSIEAIICNEGDLYTSLAYAAFFFPVIRIVNGIPYAQFATATKESAIDCVHVDLLQRSQASEITNKLLNTLGQVIAQLWSTNLRCYSLPGKFIYDDSTGFDVLYQP